MRIPKPFIFIPVVHLALSALLAGCGGGTTVNVELNEWAIEPDKKSVPAGAVTFVATNKGEDGHELVLLKTALAPDKLPVNADGDVDEEGEGVEEIGEVEDIAPGKSGEFTVTLEPGSYVLVCNLAEPEDGTVEHHYALGMRSAFKVE